MVFIKIYSFDDIIWHINFTIAVMNYIDFLSLDVNVYFNFLQKSLN